MPGKKIQDELEVIRWLEQGITYEEMVERYREKYAIETTTSMWGNFRRRRGMERRITRDVDLIPWAVKAQHRHSHAVGMLRREARRRAGHPLSSFEAEAVLDTWLEGLRASGAVVHYDPNTEQGWFYVTPRPGIDTDLIRVPRHQTGRRG